MLSASLESLRSVLCIGAHSDDIEIGCGGTVLRLLERVPDLRVHWLVLTSEDVRLEEARASAELLLSGAVDPVIEVETFRDRYLPYLPEVKERFDRLGAEVDPDVVFTHHTHDLHQDHRTLAELTYNTFRNHLVLEYEIPKYDGDLGRPNVYVHLESHHCDKKVATLLEVFSSQRDKHWFNEGTFRSLMTIRGLESRAPSGLAEAFHCRKVVLT